MNPLGIQVGLNLSEWEYPKLDHEVLCFKQHLLLTIWYAELK
jgi:hypothetical protein